MKTATVYKTYRTATVDFPNTATRTQMLHKVLDGLLLLASGAGIFTLILFLLLM